MASLGHKDLSENSYSARLRIFESERQKDVVQAFQPLSEDTSGSISCEAGSAPTSRAHGKGTPGSEVQTMLPTSETQDVAGADRDMAFPPSSDGTPLDKSLRDDLCIAQGSGGYDIQRKQHQVSPDAVSHVPGLYDEPQGYVDLRPIEGHSTILSNFGWAIDLCYGCFQFYSTFGPQQLAPVSPNVGWETVDSGCSQFHGPFGTQQLAPVYVRCCRCYRIFDGPFKYMLVT
ncbi:unnamed protein product [Clonostachys solani]|uniref:Uncharacterized protein n=1 Tax=Clonostachys solani TaxID=160281 RepID=A0A9P0ENN9_9HYPO|nr:unnamed protein product [Clonostachys solani]